jgi:transketolase
VIEDGFHEWIAGTEICLVSTGYMTHRALKAAEELGNVGVVDVFRLKPVQKERLHAVLQKYRHIVTIEEAFINNGGLDCLVENVLSGHQTTITMNKIGFDDRYVFELGDRDYLHGINGMDERAIKTMVEELRG